MTPVVGGAQICKVSVDDCHDTTDTFHVGVNWIPGLSEAGCLGNPSGSPPDYGYAEAVYAVCDLANYPAPSATWPRRAKAEYIDGSVTTGTTYFPAIAPENLPMRGRPALGAIRFDLWDSGQLRTGASFDGQQEFKESLKYSDGPDDWQARLPFYATNDGAPIAMPPDSNAPARPLTGTIDFESDQQAVMDQEILYASSKGLAYWAFLWWNRVHGVCSIDGETQCDLTGSCQNQGLGTCNAPVRPPPGAEPLGPEYHWRDAVAHDQSLQLHLSSSLRDRMHLALMIAVNRFGLYWEPTIDDAGFEALFEDDDPTSTWFELNVEQWVELASEPTYQKVLGDRPILYFFGIEGFDYWFRGGYQNADVPKRTRRAIRWIRERFRSAGLGNPYLVGLSFNPHLHPGDFYRVDEYGLDAVSVYAYPLGCETFPTLLVDGQGQYSTDPSYVPPAYATQTSAQFAGFHGQVVGQDGKQLVPTAAAGWDPRPEIVPNLYDGVQCENPNVRWAAHPVPDPCDPLTQSCSAAQQIASHLAEVRDWAEANPESTEANAILMYAWNELTEGGWLVPTIGEGTARLDEVRKVVCGSGPSGVCSAAPVGNIGGISDGILFGWAYDPDLPNRSLQVALYRDAAYPAGTIVANEIAGKPNTGVNLTLQVPGDHRFEFQLDPSLQGKKLYVHAIDPVRGSLNPVLLHNGGADHIIRGGSCGLGYEIGIVLPLLLSRMRRIRGASVRRRS